MWILFNSRRLHPHCMNTIHTPSWPLQLVDTIMINPTVIITPSQRDTGLSAAYGFHPLSNLVYTRDQQITTCR